MSKPYYEAQPSVLTRVLSDEFKEEETVSTIRRNRICRSRSRNHSSDEEGSVRLGRRFREAQLDPSHTYIKQIPLQQCSEISQSLRDRSPKLTERRFGQSLTLQNAGGITNRKETQALTPQQHYRRPLTPHKTQQQVAGFQTDSAKPCTADRDRQQEMLQNELNQKDLQLAEMQAELEKLRMDRDNIKQVAQRSEKERMKLLNDKNRMESRNTILEQELEQKSCKLHELENAMLENESHLAETKSNLEKLRKLIKENRMAELQADNKRLEGETAQLRNRNAQLSTEFEAASKSLVATQQKLEEAHHKLAQLQKHNFSKEKSYQIESMKEQYLNRQLAALRLQLQEGRTSHEVELELLVESLKKQLLEAEAHGKSMEIRVSCQSRRELQLQEQLKKQSSAEYLQLKERFRKFLQQYQKFRKEHNQLKVSYAMLSRRRGGESPPPNSELSFQLSPER